MRHEAVTATCETAGLVEYWECVSCGEKFSDADGTTPISDISLAPLGHDYAPDWDDENHFERCTRCGDVTNIAPHTFDDGVCTVCKYEDKGTEGLEYTLSADGTYYILTGVGEATASDILVPSLYQSKPVTAIGARAFANCADITSVTFGRRIESIGEAAFYGCDALGEIRYGGGVAEWCELSGQENIMARGRDLYISDERAEGAIVIPDGISAVKPYSFAYQSGITSVTVPDSVTEIGEYAFLGCAAVEKITIPFLGASLSGNDISVGYLFGGTDKIPSVLREVSVNGGSVPAGAFAGCAALTSVMLGADVTSVGSGVLGICTSLEEVGVPYLGASADDQNSADLKIGYVFGGVSRIPASLKKATVIGGSIPAGAFEGCPALTGVALGENVTYIEGGVLSGFGSLEELTVPFLGDVAGKTTEDTYQYPLGYIFGTSSYDGGVRVSQQYYASSASYSIKQYFYIPSSLRAVTVSGGNIFFGAFSNCSSLTSVTLGRGVKCVAQRAFEGCSSLTELHYEGTMTEWFELKEIYYALESECDLYIDGAKVEGVVTIPDGVESIPEFAFWHQDDIVSVILPDSVKTIGRKAFEYCTGLTAVKFPDGLTTIGEYAFNYCSSLASCDLPNSVTDMGMSAFSGCKALTSVVIPDGVTQILGLLFSNCDSLVSVSIPAGVTTIFGGAFSGCESLTTINIPDGVTEMYGNLFKNCTSLTSLEIPDGVTSIGDSAFEGCTSLTSLTSLEIPDGVTSIGDSAFEGCTSLTSLEIPDGVTSIGGYAFKDCTGLTSLEIPDGVKYCGTGILDGCGAAYTVYDNAYYAGNADNPYMILVEGKNTAITSCAVHPSAKMIAAHAFDGYVSLKTVSLPSGLSTVCEYAFNGCTSLTGIAIPDSVTELGAYAFSSCTSLTSVTIGKGLTVLEEGVLRDCTSLRSVTIPDNIVTIGTNAFMSCTSLSSVTLGKNVTSIGYAAFNVCSSLTSIKIPASVVSISKFCFSTCRNLTSVVFEDPDTWQICKSEDFSTVTTIARSELANSGTAAKALLSHDTSYWRKV